MQKDKTIIMVKYAVLLNPGHNRVYYKETKKLSVSELSVASQFLASSLSDIKIESIADNLYCTFKSDEHLDYNDLSVISVLSFTFALFEVYENGSRLCFAPVKLPKTDFLEDDITTILKYKGKTNELFTKMMVNIATLCCGSKEGAKLLDPMAGKGTTLFEGMTRGFNVCGIEQAKASAHDGSVFVKKYLEQKRIKHVSKSRTINGGKKSIGRATSFEYAMSKEDFKADKLKQFELIHGDATLADKYYKQKYFNMIVCDLPYGVQHMGRSGQSSSRNPEQLLKQSLISWKKVLKSGGAIVLAFNVNILKKQRVAELLIEAGLTSVYNDIMFEHFVDTSILRDIIIAKK